MILPFTIMTALIKRPFFEEFEPSQKVFRLCKLIDPWIRIACDQNKAIRSGEDKLPLNVITIKLQASIEIASTFSSTNTILTPISAPPFFTFYASQKCMSLVTTVCLLRSAFNTVRKTCEVAIPNRLLAYEKCETEIWKKVSRSVYTLNGGDEEGREEELNISVGLIWLISLLSFVTESQVEHEHLSIVSQNQRSHSNPRNNFWCERFVT